MSVAVCISLVCYIELKDKDVRLEISAKLKSTFRSFSLPSDKLIFTPLLCQRTFSMETLKYCSFLVSAGNYDVAMVLPFMLRLMKSWFIQTVSTWYIKFKEISLGWVGKTWIKQNLDYNSYSLPSWFVPALNHFSNMLYFHVTHEFKCCRLSPEWQM